jgi:hypothetical protein
MSLTSLGTAASLLLAFDIGGNPRDMGGASDGSALSALDICGRSSRSTFFRLLTTCGETCLTTWVDDGLDASRYLLLVVRPILAEVSGSARSRDTFTRETIRLLDLLSGTVINPQKHLVNRSNLLQELDLPLAQSRVVLLPRLLPYLSTRRWDRMMAATAGNDR